MRFIFLAIVTGVCLFLSSCGSKKNSELITGRWKVDDVTAPLPDFSQESDSMQQVYKKQAEKQNELMLNTGYYEFKKGGVSFFEFDGKKFEGKWRMSENEKTLFTKEKASPDEVQFNIKELSEGILTIENGEGKMLTRITMKKEVKE